MRVTSTQLLGKIEFKMKSKTKSLQLLKKSRYSNLKKKLDSDLFNQDWVEVETKKVKIKKKRAIDLFSGAGGLALGLRQAGFNIVGSVEIDKDATKTMQTNFPESKHIYKPIEEVEDSEIKEFKKIDLVAGGPPCVGFSVAGYRNPKDPRNLYYREYLRFIKILKPKFFLMENVPGILTIENGRVRDLMMEEFQKLGYKTSVRILEAAEFNVPQFRTRAIFIGNRIGTKNPYPKPILDRDSYLKIEDFLKDLENHPRDPLINHEWTNHSKEFEKRISMVAPGESLYSNFKDAYKRQYLGVPSMTIKENHGGTHIHPKLNRVISVREMARLQTFPDDFFFEGTMKRGMWQVGNAVPVNLAKNIGLSINSFL